MIQQFRNYSQSVAFKFVLLVISVSFVATFGFVGTVDQKQVLARIDNYELLQKEYDRVYSQQMENLQRRFGERADQIAEQIQLRYQTLDQLINQRLIIKSAAAEGIVITDKELQDYITRQPYFQTDGKFDYETYQQILRQNRIVLEDYERNVRDELLVNKYQEFLKLGVNVSDSEVEQTYRLENEKVELDYLYFDPTKFQKEVEITDAAIEAHYNENQAQFKTLPRYQIQYFKLALNDVKDAESVREREIQRYYEKNVAQYTTPGEAKARHILIKAGTDENQEVRDTKKQEITVLFDRLKAGADFETLAKEASEDLTKDKGGDLGWFKPGDILPTIEDAAFALEVGEISDVVESPFGFHIVKLDDKKPEVVKPLERVRTEIVEHLSQRRAEKKLDLEYKRLETRLKKEDNLEAVAQSFKVEAKSSEWFDENGVIPGLGSSKALVGQLRNKEVNAYGRWKRNPVQGHVFYKITQIEEPQQKPVSDVKSEIRSILREQEANKLAIQKVDDAFKQLQGGAAFEEVAKTHKLTVDSASFTTKEVYLQKIGNNPQFKKVALQLKEDQRHGKSVHEGKAHLLAFKQRKLADKEDPTAEKQKIRERLQQEREQVLLGIQLVALRDGTDIEIINPLYQNY